MSEAVKWVGMSEAMERTRCSRFTILAEMQRYQDTDGAEGLRAYQRRPGAAWKFDVDDLDAMVKGEAHAK
jgi:hypothetical protein